MHQHLFLFRNNLSMSRAIDEVVKSFEENTFSGKIPTKILFADKRYKAIDFSEKNFREIRTNPALQKIAALDAGNVEIIGAPNFSLHIFRFSCVVFQGNKRVDAGIKSTLEAYCLAQAKADGEALKYDVEVFPKDEKGSFFAKKLSFDSMDATLGSGIFRAEISRACGAARRMLEWAFAGYVAEKLSKGDIVLIDGSLQTGLTGESEFANGAFDSAKKSGAIFCGLAKTSRLFTDAGTPAPSAIFSLAKRAGISGAWNYYPVAEMESESHCADMHFVRLHESSNHAFRFEIFNEQKEQAEEVLSALAKNSCDRAFIGYPYALIAAHMAAKIRSEEIASERAIFLSRAGKRARDIQGDEASVGAHGVLDRI